MSVRNALALLVTVSAILFSAACGSGSNTSTAPPSGGFSSSNLNGTYIFSFSGSDAVNGTFFAAAGSFTANGSGGITAGTVDIVDPAYGALLSQSIGSGSGYKITSDGRGSGALATSTALGTIGIDFVLTSNSHGLISRFDNNGSGSGTFDLQSSAPAQSALTSYSFSVSGADGNGNPFVAGGSFALGGGTAISAGIEDFNDDKNPLTSTALTGSLTLGASGAPGTAVLSAAGSPYGTNFDVWPVDATHFKLIETDTLDYTVGDAFTQQTSLSAGQLVYTMSGVDSSGFLESLGGYMTYDGTSVISNGLEDFNDSGTVTQSATVAGTLNTVSPANGRYQLVLNSLYNGINGGTGTYTFAAYPTSAGILLLEIDNAGISSGAAFSQSATTFAASQGYGLNLTGANSNGEVDDIAEFTANSGGTLSDGLIDENVSGSTVVAQKLGSNGTYTFDSSGSGRGVLSYPATDTTAIGTLNLAFYVADSSTTVFIDGDSSQVGVGIIQSQTSGSATAAVSRTGSHLAALRAAVQRKKGKK